jgi:hypothetical protein
MKRETKRRLIALDPDAVSTSETAPGFIARPKGTPVYYGFLVLEDVCVDGFILGMISDFESEPIACGDAFVIAPDGSRAGLVWEVSRKLYFEEVMPPEPSRWGVWAVSFPEPMRTREDARKNLGRIVPLLRQRWEAWKSSRND